MSSTVIAPWKDAKVAPPQTQVTPSPSPWTMMQIALTQHGWVKRWPANREAAEIDYDVCRESECHECGHDGMQYHPFHNGPSYRAFCVCSACQAFVEF